MDEDQAPDQESLFPKSTGDKLREAREALGLTLADIANRTRVPMRHLEAIEQGEFAAMHSSTYAIGFAKAYARAVGLDEKAIGGEVRNSPQLPLPAATAYEAYEPRDAKRLPSRGVAMAAGAIAVLLLIGVVRLVRHQPVPRVGRTRASRSRKTPSPPRPRRPRHRSAPARSRSTATDSVWLKIYDATGKTLLEKTMAQGERYDVPADADNPMINHRAPRPDPGDGQRIGGRAARQRQGSRSRTCRSAPRRSRHAAAGPAPAATTASAPPTATATPGASCAAPRVPPGGVPDRAPDPPADAERGRDAGESPAAGNRSDTGAVIAVAQRRDPR